MSFSARTAIRTLQAQLRDVREQVEHLQDRLATHGELGVGPPPPRRAPRSVSQRERAMTEQLQREYLDSVAAAIEQCGQARLTTSDIHRAMGGAAAPSRGDATRIGSAMLALGWYKRQMRHQGALVRVYERPRVARGS